MFKISARRKCRPCMPKSHSWFSTFKLNGFNYLLESNLFVSRTASIYFIFWKPYWSLNWMALKKRDKISAGHKSYFLRVSFTVAGRIAVLNVGNVIYCGTSVQLGLVLVCGLCLCQVCCSLSRLDFCNGSPPTPDSALFSQLLALKPSYSLL